MSKLDKLEHIMDEVEAGLEKLDKADIWTANSSSWSLILVSILLFHTAVMGFFIGLYYHLKFKIYWRLKYWRLSR